MGMTLLAHFQDQVYCGNVAARALGRQEPRPDLLNRGRKDWPRLFDMPSRPREAFRTVTPW
jgi:hypothetical protein